MVRICVRESGEVGGIALFSLGRCAYQSMPLRVDQVEDESLELVTEAVVFDKVADRG